MQINGIWKFDKGEIVINSDKIKISNGSKSFSIGYRVLHFYFSVNRQGKDVVVFDVQMDNGYRCKTEVDRRVTLPYSGKLSKYIIQGAYIAFLKSLRLAGNHCRRDFSLSDTLSDIINKYKINSLPELMALAQRIDLLNKTALTLGVDPQKMKDFFYKKPVWKFEKRAQKGFSCA